MGEYTDTEIEKFDNDFVDVLKVIAERFQTADKNDYRKPYLIRSLRDWANTMLVPLSAA
jgi:hypothetical protein